MTSSSPDEEFDPIPIRIIANPGASEIGTRGSTGISSIIIVRGKEMRIFPPSIPAMSVTGSWVPSHWNFKQEEEESGGLNGEESILVRVRLDMVIDQWPETGGLDDLYIVPGTGKSSGPLILTDHGDHVLLDTGVSQFTIANDGSLIREIWSGGTRLAKASDDNGICFVDAAGNKYTSRGGSTQLVVEYNGPASAHVKIVGELTNPSGVVVTGYECQLWTYAQCSVLHGRLGFVPIQGSIPHLVSFDSAQIDFATEISTQQGHFGSVQSSADGSTLIGHSLASDEVIAQRLHPSGSRVMLGSNPGTTLAEVLDPAFFPSHQVLAHAAGGYDLGLALFVPQAHLAIPTTLSANDQGLLSLKLWPDDHLPNMLGPAFMMVQGSSTKEFAIGALSIGGTDLLDWVAWQSFPLQAIVVE